MNKEKFLVSVSNTLLIKLKMAGIDPNDAASFFGCQANAMLECPANYGPKSPKATNAKNHQLKKEVWLMRGFYPGTPQMFKISIAENDAYGYTYQYYVKVSEPKINPPTTRNRKEPIPISSRNESMFSHKQLEEHQQKMLHKELEKEVLDGDLNIDPIVSKKIVFTPKCISPKGMPIYRLDYKKG